MSALGVFNLLVILAVVIALAVWGVRAAIRGGARIVLDEQAKRSAREAAESHHSAEPPG